MKSSFVAVALLGVFTLANAQIPDGSGMMVTPSRPTSAVASAVAATADTEQDLQGLQKDLKDLTLRVEELERQKAELEAKIKSGTPDATTYATKEELKLSESRTREAIAAEGTRVQGTILEEIKAAKASVAAKSVETPATTTPIAATPSKLLAAATPEEKALYTKEGVHHTVAAGDTLSSIARQYRSTMRGIVVANEITNPNKLLVGRDLFIPTTTK